MGLKAQVSPRHRATASAISGLLMVLFLISHLAGLIPALIAPASFEAYAISLHHRIWLPLLEIGLAITALVHISLTALTVIANKQAGNSATLVSRRAQPMASLAARGRLGAGLITLVFLVIHLLQLRWPRPIDGGERAALLSVLHQPIWAMSYAAAALAIGLHLLHGNESAHRSMGWLTPANAGAIRLGGRVLAALIGGGFLTLSVLLSLEASR